jgi:outer membrane immunogenic protein
MKRIIAFVAAAALTLWMGDIAGAADLAVKAPVRAAPPPAPVTSWTGCYINGGGGYGMWNQENQTFNDTPVIQESIVVTTGGRGWFGTIGAGCDYQFNQNIVIGAFGDFDFMSLKGSIAARPDVVGDETEKWAWGIGARVGWLVTPNLLTYVNGGYTQTRFDGITLVFADGDPTHWSIAAHTYKGWFIGGGTEYNLGWIPGLFWRSEYRYASYSADDLPILDIRTGQPGTAVCEDSSSTCHDHSRKFVQTIRSELVWRFNWTGGAPVAAKY